MLFRSDLIGEEVGPRYIEDDYGFKYDGDQMDDFTFDEGFYSQPPESDVETFSAWQARDEDGPEGYGPSGYVDSFEQTVQAISEKAMPRLIAQGDDSLTNQADAILLQLDAVLGDAQNEFRSIISRIMKAEGAGVQVDALGRLMDITPRAENRNVTYQKRRNEAVEIGKLGKLLRDITEEAEGGESAGGSIAPKSSSVKSAGRSKKKAKVGKSVENGIPPNAPAHVQEILRKIPHRNKNMEKAGRTMLFNLLNVMGMADKTQGHNPLRNAHIQNILGMERGANDGNDIVDNDTLYNGLAKKVRQLSNAIVKGQDDSWLQDVARMMYRHEFGFSGENESIVNAYQRAVEAGDNQAVSIEAGDYPHSKAEEWFIRNWARSTRSPDVRKNGRETAFIMSTSVEGAKAKKINMPDRDELMDMADMLTEQVASVSEGLVPKNKVKKYHRVAEIQNISEMRTPAHKAVGGSSAVHPSIAKQYAREAADAMPPEQAHAVRDFAGLEPDEDVINGISYVTPEGGVSRGALDNPNTSIPMSGPTSSHGPGVYLQSPRKSPDSVSADAIKAMINRIVPEGGATRGIAHSLAEMIEETNAALKNASLELASAQRGGDRRFLESKIRHLGLKERVLYDMLDERVGGINELKSIPVTASIGKTFDFSGARMYSLDEGPNNISHVIEDMVAKGFISREGYTSLYADLPESFSGEELYRSLTNKALLGDSQAVDPTDAKVRLSEYLSANGYEGIKTTDATVVFDPNNIRHIHADDLTESKLLDLESANYENTRITNSLIEEFAADPGARADPRNFMGVARQMQEFGTPPEVVRGMRKMWRQDPLDETDINEIQKFGKVIQMSKNSHRIRGFGAHWFADMIQPKDGVGFFEAHGSEVARSVMPIFEELNKLPDARGKAARWLRKSQFWGRIPQPESHARIFKAVDGGPSFIARLTDPQERRIAEQIATTFRNEHNELVRLGIIVGDATKLDGVDGYIPHVWDAEALRARPQPFIEGLTKYFQREGHDLREAQQLSDITYKRLTDDEGVEIMDSEHVAKIGDHLRSRQLKMGREEMDALGMSDYLVNDLTGVMAKYFDQTVRRKILADKFGGLNGGYEEYKGVALGGAKTAAELLTKGRVVVRDSVKGDPTFQRVAVEHDTVTPITHDYGQASAIISEVMETLTAAGDTPRARRGAIQEASNILINAHPNPAERTSPDFLKRVEAIVNSLADFGGVPGTLSNQNAAFMDAMMNSLQRKPIEFMGAFGQKAMKFSRGVRAFNAVTLLGYTTLTSIPDMVLPLVRSNSFSAFAKGMAKYKTDPEYQSAIRNIGVSIENIVNDRMANIHGTAGGRFQNAFFNATLLTPWTNYNREVAAAVGFEAISAEARRAQSLIMSGRKATPAYRKARNFLKRYGLESYAEEGSPTIPSLNRLKNAPRNEQDAVRFAIHRFTNEAIFTPNPNDIPLWAQTPWGLLVFQLKSFPLMMSRLSKEVLTSDAGKMVAITSLLTAVPGAGAAAIAAKDTIQMRGGEEGDEAKLRERKFSKIASEFGWDVEVHGKADTFLGWYLEGMLAGAGLGLLGDMLWTLGKDGPYNQNRALSFLLGPGVGVAGDGMTMIAGAKHALIDDGTNSQERAALRAAAGRIPIVGGNRAVREAAANLAGPARGDGTSTGGSSFGKRFGKGFGG